MTGRERFLTALRGGVPDRVPVTPDFSNMIPAKRSGLPFWDVYFFDAVSLWDAYLETADHFGIELWNVSGVGTPFVYDEAGIERKVRHRYDRPRDAMVRETTVGTPDGVLTMEEVCFRYDPPTATRKYIKDFDADWKAFRHLLKPPIAIDAVRCAEFRKACETRGQAFGLATGFPGFHQWFAFVDGGIEALSYRYADAPALLDEWFELDLAAGTRAVELMIAQRPDYLFFGGSGAVTLASPDLARRFAIPALKAWTRLAKEAGIPTLLHACGKSRSLVDMLVEETDLDCVNPLEPPPMGDVDLAELKRARGGDIALMGNLHTTDVMLRGTAEEVYRASVEAMRAAGQGGGFILSTGDQCPRDTPEDNIRAMIRAAHERGVYDRDTGRLIEG